METNHRSSDPERDEFEIVSYHRHELHLEQRLCMIRKSSIPFGFLSTEVTVQHTVAPELKYETCSKLHDREAMEAPKF